MDVDGIDDGKRGRNLLNGGVSLDVNDCHHRMEAVGYAIALLTCFHTEFSCSERE